MRESRRGGLRGDHAIQVIALQINGRHVDLDEDTLLLGYLARLGVDPRSVAVEHNGEIVERDRYGVNDQVDHVATGTDNGEAKDLD